VIFASYHSYRARGIATEFAESDFIGKAIACMLLVSFVGVPTMIIVSDEPRARYFVMTSIIFVLCTAILLFIFIPKAWAAFGQSAAGRPAMSRTAGTMTDSFRRSLEAINSSSRLSTAGSSSRLSTAGGSQRFLATVGSQPSTESERHEPIREGYRHRLL